MACALCPRVVADHRATSTDDPHSTRSRQNKQQIARQARHGKLQARARASSLKRFALGLPDRVQTKPFMLDPRNNAVCSSETGHIHHPVIVYRVALRWGEVVMKYLEHCHVGLPLEHQAGLECVCVKFKVTKRPVTQIPFPSGIPALPWPTGFCLRSDEDEQEVASLDWPDSTMSELSS